ncbi:MAG: hypothetical protein ACE14V_01345 [bacterium]
MIEEIVETGNKNYLPTLEQIDALFNRFETVNEKREFAKKILKIKEAAFIKKKTEIVATVKPDRINEAIDVWASLEKKEYESALEVVETLDSDWHKLGILADRYRMIHDAYKISLRIG